MPCPHWDPLPGACAHGGEPDVRRLPVALRGARHAAALFTQFLPGLLGRVSEPNPDHRGAAFLLLFLTSGSASAKSTRSGQRGAGLLLRPGLTAWRQRGLRHRLLPAVPQSLPAASGRRGGRLARQHHSGRGG